MDLLHWATDLEPDRNGNSRQPAAYFFASLADCILSGGKLSNSRRVIISKTRSFYIRYWLTHPDSPASFPNIMDRWFLAEQKKVCQDFGYRQGTAFFHNHGSLVHLDLFRGPAFRGRYSGSFDGYGSESMDSVKKLTHESIR